MSVLRDAMDSLDDDGYAALIASACAVGSADGRFDPSEKRTLLQMLGHLGFDRDGAAGALDGVLENIDGMSAGEAADWAAEQATSDEVGEACVVLAAAIAAKSGGIAAKEGVIIQRIAEAVGVGYPSDRYMELLGEGMQLV